jgi:hypothetical protein
MPIDMSAAKAPPRKRAANTSNAKQNTLSVETMSQTERRAKGLMELAQLGQGICLMAGLYADAAAIGQHFPPVAGELANVADSSDMIAKPIDFIIEVGPYGALIAAGMPLVMQILANHRVLKADMLLSQGVVPPELLEEQMKAQVARMQLEARKQQQQAMYEAQQAQKEFDAMMAEQTAAV